MERTECSPPARSREVIATLRVRASQAFAHRVAGRARGDPLTQAAGAADPQQPGGNAIKFTDAGEVVVTLWSRQHDPLAARLEFESGGHGRHSHGIPSVAVRAARRATFDDAGLAARDSG